jgi:hypothetical protein
MGGRSVLAYPYDVLNTKFGFEKQQKPGRPPKNTPQSLETSKTLHTLPQSLVHGGVSGGTPMTTLEATQLREQALTLLLIERDQINERLVELDFKEIKNPALKRGKWSKRPPAFTLFDNFRRAAS